jgi:hypothetical protein
VSGSSRPWASGLCWQCPLRRSQIWLLRPGEWGPGPGGKRGAARASQAPGPDLCWLGSEAWYEDNLNAMLRCVDLSRDLVGTPGPSGNTVMQLKMTALTSTRLCVRDRQDGEGGKEVAVHWDPLTMPPATPFQKALTSWIRRLGACPELSPERLAEAMDSGQVRNKCRCHQGYG